MISKVILDILQYAQYSESQRYNDSLISDDRQKVVHVVWDCFIIDPRRPQVKVILGSLGQSRNVKAVISRTKLSKDLSQFIT